MVWHRIDDPPILNREEIITELNNGKEVLIQFSHSRYRLDVLIEINNLCSISSNKLHIRFYGHYGAAFDCNILKHISYVKHLSIDCLDSAVNTSAIADLLHLEVLSLGIYELHDAEILRLENLQNLKKLSLGSTKTKQLNLSYLETYNRLQELVISGHTKQIATVGKLKQLESLWLTSISKTPLDFLNGLKQLQSFSLLLGGRPNLAEVNLDSLEKLKIIRVRGFNYLENLGNFPALKELTIEDQIQLQSISFPDTLQSLSTITLSNCKKLSALPGLENLSKLKNLSIYQTNIDFDNFIENSLPKSLINFRFYTAKSNLDKIIKEQIKHLGYYS